MNIPWQYRILWNKGAIMLIYEFLVEGREIAIKNGYMAEVKRLSEVIACLTIEQAEKECAK